MPESTVHIPLDSLALMLDLPDGVEITRAEHADGEVILHMDGLDVVDEDLVGERVVLHYGWEEDAGSFRLKGISPSEEG